MAYRASALRSLALAQMVFGALMIVFGVGSIFTVNHWSSYVGFGIWVGIWVSLKQKQSESCCSLQSLTFYRDKVMYSLAECCSRSRSANTLTISSRRQGLPSSRLARPRCKNLWDQSFNIPQASELLKIGSFQFSPPWAEIVFKCPTNVPDLMVKCPS